MFHVLPQNGNLNQIQPTESLKKDQPEIHIVLDIDDTLANGFYEENVEKFLQHYPHLTPLVEKQLFISAIKSHIIHPGTFEFMQWLFQIPNIKVSFFSGGDPNRNELFVQKLLMKALGEKYNTIKDQVKVYSREDRARSTQEETNYQFKMFKLTYGEMKKDLKKILKTDNVENTILIDDDSSYIAYKQERNVFVVPGLDESPFYSFHQYEKEYPDDMGKYILPMNHIFFIVGVLNKILSMKTNSLADNLFSLQYSYRSDHGHYKRNKDLGDDHQYYLDGLAELQKVNPKIEFYGGELAQQHFHKTTFTKRF